MKPKSTIPKKSETKTATSPREPIAEVNNLIAEFVRAYSDCTSDLSRLAAAGQEIESRIRGGKLPPDVCKKLQTDLAPGINLAKKIGDVLGL